MSKKVWFITGISSGLGKALTEKVIERGDFVIGTFRNQQQTDAFNLEHNDKAFALTLDITQHQAIEAAVNEVAQKFKKIDVLVNNAGYGMAGAIEETSMEEVRDIFEANVFGTLKVTQAFLPLLRKQKSGHIIQISSHGGIRAVSGFGIYNATKFALEGFSEALAAEILPLGIKLTIVEPGPFRTKFAADGLKQANQRIDDYNTTAGIFRERIKMVDGKQEGDPIKAASVIIDVLNAPNPPLRLPLGKIALDSIKSKINSVSQDVESNRKLAESVVY